MLAITLRILAGASYLDVGWPYGQRTSSVYNIFNQTLSALDQVLPKMKFPKTEEECSREAEKFVKLSKVPIKSVVASLDGILFETKQNSKKYTKDCRKYFNRKNFFRSVFKQRVRLTTSFYS